MFFQQHSNTQQLCAQVDSKDVASAKAPGGHQASEVGGTEEILLRNDQLTMKSNKKEKRKRGKGVGKQILKEEGDFQVMEQPQSVPNSLELPVLAPERWPPQKNQLMVVRMYV